MKNANRLFGRKLSKLILTQIISLGLVAGFAVSPASATMDIDYPFGGEIGIVRAGNSFAWTTWIDTAPKYNSSVRETAFDTSVEFNVVACEASSVMITDCLGAINDPNDGTILVARGKFVGILQDDTFRTSTSSGSTTPPYLTEIAIDQNGKTSSAIKWRAIDTSGLNQGAIVALGAAAYKFYVFMWVRNQNFGSSNPFGVADFIQPYYASAPLTVDFRPLSTTPTISTQPTGGAKTAGETLSLSVTATRTGSGALSYQWKKGGTAISGATSASLSIPNVATGDAGSYTVDVTNTETGNAPVTVSSSAAVVTVAAAASTPAASTATPSAAAVASKAYKAKPIEFSLGTSTITSASKKNLKASVAAAGKSAKYTITGTAGQMTGVSDKAVRALAKKRANVLKAYLVKLGVSKSSITIKTKVVKQGKKPKASVLALY